MSPTARLMWPLPLSQGLPDHQPQVRQASLDQHHALGAQLQIFFSPWRPAR